MISRESQRWIVFGCEAVVGGWGVTALIINLFQCELPTPWIYTNDKKCIDRTAFWTYYSIANITTDIAIIILICESVLKIQTSWSKKLLVMSIFGSRILYVLLPQLRWICLACVQQKTLTMKEKCGTCNCGPNLSFQQGFRFHRFHLRDLESRYRFTGGPVPLHCHCLHSQL
jgi:hypothetical protein